MKKVDMKHGLALRLWAALVLLLMMGLMMGGCKNPLTDAVLRLETKSFTSFDFLDEGNSAISADVSGTIDEEAKTIALTLPAGTNVTSLVPAFTIQGKEVRVGTAVQTSGESVQNFTSSVVYTVVAWDGSEVDYTVTVTVTVEEVDDPPPGPSAAKAITSFIFSALEATGVIDEAAKTIGVTVPIGTDVTALVPTIVVSTGAQVSPASGVAQDFSNSVNYTVTAEDDSTVVYTVTVTVAEAVIPVEP